MAFWWLSFETDKKLTVLVEVGAERQEDGGGGGEVTIEKHHTKGSGGRLSGVMKKVGAKKKGVKDGKVDQVRNPMPAIKKKRW